MHVDVMCNFTPVSVLFIHLSHYMYFLTCSLKTAAQLQRQNHLQTLYLISLWTWERLPNQLPPNSQSYLVSKITLKHECGVCFVPNSETTFSGMVACP